MKSLLTFVLSLFLGLNLSAQELSISARVDTNAILIGEQLTLSLKGNVSQGENFVWPLFPDSLDGFEVISRGKLDTVKKGNTFQLNQEFIITSFDSGYFVIPPLTFTQMGSKAQTEVIAIAVHFPELNEDDQYFDIKGIMEPGLDWEKIILIVAVSILFLGGILFFIVRLNRKKNAEVIAPKYRLKPYAQAYEDLEKLDQKQLWQKGEVKNYYSSLTDILGHYLENQLGISALEKTSDEIIESLQSLRIKKDFFLEISSMLKTSSFAKFAKAKPSAFDNEQALKIVREFIDITKPQAETKKEEQDD